MTEKTAIALFLAMFMVLPISLTFPSVARGETFQGWHIGPEGGNVSESNGVLTMSGGDGHTIAPYLLREFSPTDDFEISFDLKAETLGEVIIDQAGEGFELNFGNINIASYQFRVVAFWLRARAGGQFLLSWHDELCSQRGWTGRWEPFVYNGIGYDNGYDFWHPNPPQDRSNAPVKPDVWYIVHVRVKEMPFTVTGEVCTENGTLLGSLTVDTMNDFTFKDISHLYMSTGAGGTFYIRNFMISDVQTVGPEHITITAEPSVILGSPVNIHGNLTNDCVGLANELVVLKYTFRGADEWYLISSTFTDAVGNYNIQWVNTATGTFTLRAEWKGNSTHPSVYADVALNSLPCQNGVFFVESNSTVASIAFNSTTLELGFTVSGPSETAGYVKVTIAKSLVSNPENIKVYLDGNQLDYEVASNADSWLLSFTYTHSTHKVNIHLATNAGGATILDIEYWTWIFAAIIVVVISASLPVYFKKSKR